MDGSQPSFTDVEYSRRRRVTKRQEFLTRMDQVIPWDEWVVLVEPHYFNSKRGRKPVPIETMLRMYLLQVWFNLSDEAVEDAVNDSYAMRQFMHLDFTTRQVPDATTLLHFRHLLEKHQLGKAMFDAINRVFEANGWVMRGGTVVGEHSAILAGPGERITLSHSAEDRSIFARGALAAARWGHGQKPGLYSMTDVLGL